MAATPHPIDRVLKELERGHDELSDWAVGIGDAFFRTTAESKVIDVYGKLVTWAQSQSQFTKPARDDFSRADNADAWVVACAKANNCSVATHEAFEPNSRKKVKIPNACSAVGVTWVNTSRIERSRTAWW